MKRIPVAPAFGDVMAPTTSLRCRLGWHRLRFIADAAGVWKPRCTRCRRVAVWWLVENGAVITTPSGKRLGGHR